MKKIFRVMSSVCAAGIMAISEVSMSGCTLWDTILFSIFEPEEFHRQCVMTKNIEWDINMPYETGLLYSKYPDVLDLNEYRVEAVDCTEDFFGTFVKERSIELEERWELELKQHFSAVRDQFQYTVDFDLGYSWMIKNRIPDGKKTIETEGVEARLYMFRDGLDPEDWQGQVYETLYMVLIPSESLLYSIEMRRLQR